MEYLKILLIVTSWFILCILGIIIPVLASEKSETLAWFIVVIELILLLTTVIYFRIN